MIDRKIITEQLRTLGVKPALAGYNYLKYALAICYDDINNLHSITKLYCKVAKELDSTPSRVERAMRHVIENAWHIGSSVLQNRIFGYTVSEEKTHPTNKEFIAAVVEYLHEEFDDAEVV